jgi:hypothetical protein
MRMKAGVTYLYCTRNASLWRKEYDTSIHSKARSKFITFVKIWNVRCCTMNDRFEIVFVFVLLLLQYINYISHAGVSYWYKREMASTCVMYRALKENTGVFRRGHHNVPQIIKKKGWWIRVPFLYEGHSKFLIFCYTLAYEKNIQQIIHIRLGRMDSVRVLKCPTSASTEKKTWRERNLLIK